MGMHGNIVLQVVRITAIAVGMLTLVRAAGATYDSATVPTDAVLTVLRAIPEGDSVPGSAQQITVTFDRPVSALGVMAVDATHAPVVVPSVACHWHWLDPRALACELNAAQALAPATRFTVTVAAGLVAQDGATLGLPYQWSFATERPSVKEYSFSTWRAPGTPVIRLVFNQPVTLESVEATLHFGAQPGVIATPDPFDHEPVDALPLPQARRVWLVAPLRELPGNTSTRLSVVPGLRSRFGPLPGTERRTVVAFDTFPEFKFLGIRCSIGTTSTLIGAATAPAAQPACNPFGTVALVFSAPVIATELEAHLALTPDLTNGRTDFDPWANVYAMSWLGQPHVRGAQYGIDLPEHLRAFQPYSIDGLHGVRDEFGRTLDATVMSFRTDHRPPRLKVIHPVSVLEKNAPTSMPFYVTNLTDIEIHYRTLTLAGGTAGLTVDQPVDRVWDVAYATPAKIRDLLGGRSGVVTGSLHPHPTPLAAQGDRYFDASEDDPGIATGRPDQDFFAEVTPYQVHAKLGAYNTLVWVTSLATGLPIANARVRVYRDSYQSLTATPVVLAEAVTGRDGTAMLAGRQALERQWQNIPAHDDARANEPFMVRVDGAKDMALLPLDGSFSIDTYRASRGTFWSGFGSPRDHIHAWGTTAQGVYKLGDTVQYKVYLRDQDNLGLTAVAERSGYTLEVVDPTGKVVHTEADVTLSEFGAFAGSMRVPRAGAVGWYSFNMTAPAGPDAQGAAPGSWTPMRVLVADFTPAPFQVTNTLNGTLFQPGARVEIVTQAAMHAGGPYTGADSRVTARLLPQAVDIVNPLAAGFAFASSEPGGTCRSQREPDVVTVHQSAATTNDRGEFTTEFTLPDANLLSAKLEVESAVRDERGKYVANRSYAEFRGRDRFVGLRSESWTFEAGKPAALQYLVVDHTGAVIPGVPVTVAIQVEVVNAARVKGAGDAYLTSYDTQWQTDASCLGTSGKAVQVCTFTPSRPGLYSIAATVKDTHGREHTTELCVWVTGKGRVLWEEPADMSLSVVPEKNSYKVGDRARYLVKNPFPGAMALITVERFGVLKHWVQTLSGNTPVIEFDVEPDFVPGFYLSVLVVSPRVAPVPGTAASDEDGVDLGRPTYRLGYLKVPVADPYKTLDVHVKTDRPSFKPRDMVTVRLSATPHGAPAAREPVEFAVVVLDEAVFDLIQDGKQYFDPYRGLYRFDSLDLVNYNLLTRLVGLQKFEKKGANSGGDGGAGFDMRSVSQYVAYWNPAVLADRHGNARVQFPLPDNLTGWRVFAIAVTPRDRLGLGDYKFKSSKLTELRPVLPNQLTAGDRFTAGFSVLNRAAKTRTLAVELTARGPLDPGVVHSQQTVTLGPFKRATVWLPLTTTVEGRITLSAVAADALDRDALTQTLPVHRRVSLDVAGSYGTTLAAGVDETVQFPADMLPGVGALEVSFSPGVLGDLDGALRYVRDYPYLCWEQRLTKALMAANYAGLRPFLAADFTWPEAQALPQTMLDDAASFQAPNGGMGFWTADDARVSPYLSAVTAVAFNRLRAAGYRVPEDVQRHLDDYLQALLRSNTAPSFYSEGMVSSVRAVALQALAERHRLAVADLQRYEKYAPRMDLFGLAAYLNAALEVPEAGAIARSLAGQILAHGNQSGGQLQFTETWDDGYSQLLGTPMRSNCAILSAFVHYGATRAGAALVGDVPFKLVRAITQTRGNRDHWQNTQENVVCAAALADYAAAYEKEVPALHATATLDGALLGASDFHTFRDTPVALSRPNAAADAGHRAVLRIERQGAGRLYYATRLRYALTARAASETNAGMEVRREYSVQRAGRWQLLDSPVLKRGELVRVDVYLSVPAARHFVVVDDPVPGGLEPVNRELATTSSVDADATDFQAAGGSFWFKHAEWNEYGVELWSFYHRELLHEAARFYADYLPAGHYHLSYGAQAIAAGEFEASPTLAQEMYDPDVYGKSLPAHVTVRDE